MLPTPITPSVLLAQGFAGDLLPFSAFHLAVHPRQAAGEGQDVAQHRVGDGQGERVQGAAELDPITGACPGVDRIDPGPPLRDHLEPRRAGLDHALGIAVIPADRSVEPARISQKVGLLHTLAYIRDDEFEIVFFKDRPETVHKGDHVGGGERI
jgi:hypothetical protein